MSLNFRAFLTGSRAYGRPTPDSDIDLVVFITEADLEMLTEQSDNKGQITCDDPDYLANMKAHSLRFGNLNLLCCTDEKSHAVWREGTRTLKAKKPVTREDAVRLMHSLRAKARLVATDDRFSRQDWQDSKTKAIAPKGMVAGKSPASDENNGENIPF